MKNLFRSIARTPGLLLMAILMVGFLLNAGVNYLDATGLEGPNLAAAAILFLSQIVIVALHQLRRLDERVLQGKSGDALGA